MANIKPLNKKELCLYTIKKTLGIYRINRYLYKKYGRILF